MHNFKVFSKKIKLNDLTNTYYNFASNLIRFSVKLLQRTSSHHDALDFMAQIMAVNPYVKRRDSSRQFFLPLGTRVGV